MSETSSPPQPLRATEAAAHFDRGVLLENEGDLIGARTAYECCAALDERHVEAIASLAWFDAQAGDSIAARRWGESALALDAGNHLARMALAFAELQDKQLDAAGARLAALFADEALTPVNRSIVLGMIGDLNDAQGDTGRAFKAYEAANAQLRAFYPTFAEMDANSPLGHARRLIGWFEKADPDPWRRTQKPASASGPRSHVFLVGFPRSGTTLLENVLAARPDVVTLEEKDTLAKAAASFLMSDDGLHRLAALDADEAQEHRGSYWEAVRSFGVEPERRVFIDKMPLATVLLPLIAKLFPEARVLFAVRDPRDVVLSCFRRRFGMNAAMYQFLSLESAATYYNAVMRLAEVYRGLLPLQQHIVRYESLVDDFEGTTRAACRFIDVEWAPAMHDFAAAARSRGINTPSGVQVTRGLNREGQGAWRRYREQMQTVLPLLDPWVRRFGYQPD